MSEPLTPEEKMKRNLRWLIWLYFWLLIFEGALRKWVVPSLANPLLIVRDPVVVMIYILAIRARLFPRDGWIVALAAIAMLSYAVSFIPLWPYLPPSRIALVSAFGFRSNFLHLPLIFIMPRVLRGEDVKRIGWWTLVVVVPMALLMVGQFRAAPDAFLNRTAGGEGEMMTSALGKVRTAATFSFVIGVVAYFAMTTAFLIWAALRQDVYRTWLLLAAGSAMVIGIVVSGSRSVVGACAVVAASLVALFFLRPKVLNRFAFVLLGAVVLGFILTQTPVFKEGFNVLSTRFEEAAAASEYSMASGFVDRLFSVFGDGLFILGKAPFLGYGLGVGTNAGAKFLTGRALFLLSEGEWSRIFLESGPLLGMAFVLWRCAAVFHIGFLCTRSVRVDNVLPLLLFSASFLPMLSGQFGQPTVLGFSVFVMGLALAARNADVVSSVPESAPSGPPADRGRRPIPRQSEYARRLHSGESTSDHTNGSVDR